MNNFEKNNAIKKEIKLSVYRHLIEVIMSEVEGYDELPNPIKLQLSMIMKNWRNISKEDYVS